MTRAPPLGTDAQTLVHPQTDCLFITLQTDKIIRELYYNVTQTFRSACALGNTHPFWTRVGNNRLENFLLGSSVYALSAYFSLFLTPSLYVVPASRDLESAFI